MKVSTAHCCLEVVLIRSHPPVIKLKQVEHVRNERKTLGAVAGHPFITTLITTFSDEQCLYMLVWSFSPGEAIVESGYWIFWPLSTAGDANNRTGA